jgi:hypothetical protein
MEVRNRLFRIATLSIVFPAAGLTQSSNAPATGAGSEFSCHSSVAPSVQAACNGISVGRPKIFDNRSLTLQIEALEKVLKQQQSANPAIDLKSVVNALANTQGLTQSEVSTVLSVLGNPTPSTSLTTDAKTGNIDSNGNSLPNSTDTQTSKNVASVTPAVPTFDSFATLPTGFKPAFGPSASDLLNDQVSLSYQITNLQMILERALSDRLYADDTKCPGDQALNCTRLQTVLGFNVTIDPPRVANDAVAVVEIALTKAGNSVPGSANASDRNGDNELSLVAMMPQEKTYNSAALSSSSHAYSGAAVANAFQISGGYRRRNQTFYVYRDTDTLAYERMTKDGELVFGWMFRPVLGRRSVSPGLRQLFAVVSLPRIDCDHLGIVDNSQSEKSKSPDMSPESLDKCSIELKPVVHTYWKKFDRATQTSFERHDANRASEFWFGLSAGLGKPQIFDNNSYRNTAEYNNFRVRSSASYEEALRPVVENVSWHPTGEKSVIVSVTGRNFFTNTQVKLGDTTYSEDNKNLVIKSDQSFDLITTVDQLTAGPGSILGRYGLSRPLVQPDPPAVDASIKDGFQIEDPHIGAPIDGYRSLDISLVKRADPNDPTDHYLQDQREVRQLEEMLDSLKADYTNNNFTAVIKGKNAELAKLQASKTKATATITRLQSEIKKLSDDNDAALKAIQSAQSSLKDRLRDFYSKYDLVRRASPYAPSEVPGTASSDKMSPASEIPSLTPIVSVNGTALEMPYEIYQRPATGYDPVHVELRASFADSLITGGVAQIKVSWPFYDPDRWTKALLYRDPNGQFKLDRVSQKTVIIRRDGDGSGRDPGFAKSDEKHRCWTLIAGDTPVTLFTEDCPYKAGKPAPAPAKGKPAPRPDPGPVIKNGTNVVSVTVGDKETLPSQAVLLSPDLAVYHVTIPEFTDKKPAADTAPQPVALQQYDAAWLKFTLPKGKTAKSAEANGVPLQVHVLKPDAKPTAKPADTPPQTIEVEITRAITAKCGSVPVTVFDAAGQDLARQTVSITGSQCNKKKGDTQ